MRFFKATNPMVFELFQSMLVPTMDETREELVHVLKNILVDQADRVFCAAAFDGDIPVGLVLAYVEEGASYALLLQVCLDERFEQSILDRLFFKLLSWAESREIQSIRLDTARWPGWSKSKWNFKPHTQAVTTNVNEQLSRLIDRLSERSVQDGSKIPNDQHPDTATGSAGGDPEKRTERILPGKSGDVA